MLNYQDLASLPENERIKIIGRKASDTNKPVSFYVEDKEKADRYVSQITAEFPDVHEIARFLDTPIKGIIAVMMGTEIAKQSIRR